MLWFKTIWNVFARNPPSLAIARSEQAAVRLEDKARLLKRDERWLLKLETKLVKLTEQANRLLDRAKAISETLGEDVRESLDSIDQAEKAMEALRAELEVEKDVTIPTLLSRIQEYQAMNEANIVYHNTRKGQLSRDAPGGGM